jgi:tRNA threonylcarbamoyladenosine biosynthesis protein TsaE
VIAERFLPDEDATEDLARRMAGALPVRAPDEPLVVYLEGELGAGKTSFARGLLRALGEQGPVRSPTYGLLSQYLLPAGRILHLDLYRLQAAEELEALALRDHLAGSRLWLIEWPARGAGALPPPDLTLALQVEGQGRLARLQSGSAAGNQWLGAVFGCPEA